MIKRTRRQWLIGATALAVVGMVAEGGAQLRLGFEDRGDPSPRQVAVGLKIAGLALGLAVSWTRHAPSIRAL